jgi:hypothetical protein
MREQQMTSSASLDSSRPLRLLRSPPPRQPSAIPYLYLTLLPSSISLLSSLFPYLFIYLVHHI